MPVTVVLDHPRTYIARRVGRTLKVLIGFAFIVIGTTAWLVFACAAGVVLMWLGNEEFAAGVEPYRRFFDEFLLTSGIAALCVGLGVRRRGKQLARRERRLMLFLRRFGYDHATQAVTFAIATVLGGSWRLVTLDDASVAPVSVSATVTRSLRLTRAVSGLVSTVGRQSWVLTEGLARVLAAYWCILVWSALAAPILDWLFGTRTFGIVLAAAGGRAPRDAVAFSLEGFYAALFTSPFFVLPPLVRFASGFVVWIEGFSQATVMTAVGAAVATYLLATRLQRTSAEALRVIQETRTVPILTDDDVGKAVSAVTRASLKRFGGRLVVTRVATSVWRQAVSSFAASSTIVLIDVSESTEHILWEIETLRQRGAGCVFIGEHDRVVALNAAAAAALPAQARLAQLLDGQQVLAYRTDRAGLRRFSRALRNTLRAQPVRYEPTLYDYIRQGKQRMREHRRRALDAARRSGPGPGRVNG